MMNAKEEGKKNVDGMHSHEEVAVDSTLCCHVWIIDGPQGPTSRGRCQICGIEKEFCNYIEEYKYGHTTPKGVSEKESLAS